MRRTARPTTGASKNWNKSLIVTKAAMTVNIIKGTPLVLYPTEKKINELPFLVEVYCIACPRCKRFSLAARESRKLRL